VGRDEHSADTYDVELGDRGRLVLPVAVRRRCELAPGDRLIVTVEGPGVVRLTTAREAARRGRGLLRRWAGDRDLVAELLAERRRDARDE
jgi:AbrB family looped-hinge helix DNA binding protein